LGTGILKSTTSTGTLTIATAADFPTLNQSTTGNAANVTGTVAVANGGTGASTITGLVKGNGSNVMTAATAGVDYVAPSGSFYLGTSQVLLNRSAGAQTLNGVSITGNAASATSASTATNATNATNALNLTGSFLGDISGTQTATVIGANKVTNLMLAGSITEDKLSGSIPASKLVGTDITTVGTITSGTWSASTIDVAHGGTGVTSATGSGSVVLSTSPTLVTPNLGTPSTLVGTNISGTAANLTAGNVTTNANLTGDVTSVGNATTLAASGVVSGSYGSSTAIPTFTVDSKGRLTSASTTSITAGVNTLAYTTASSYATGGSVSGTTLTLAAADATNPGLISTGAQTIAGAKTFNGNLTTAAINATTVTTPIYASTPQTLTSGSTITWNPANGLNASVTLSSSNSTLSFSPTPVSGSYGTLVVTQGSGNNTLTLPTGVTNKVWGSTSTSTIALSTASGAVDIVNFYYDGSSYYWNVSQGYGQNVTSSVLGGTTSNNTAIGYNALLNTTGGNNIAV
jgi:hypothetical protein